MLLENATARRLHRYMRYRARREGVPHKLPPAFYLGALRAGIRSLFGIEVHGSTLVDTRHPQMLADWLERERRRS